MVTRLTDVIAYIYRKYPNRRELSKARLIGMLYLIDWKYALQYNSQLTGIEWSIDNNGPHPDAYALNSIENDFQSLMKLSHVPRKSPKGIEPKVVSTIDFVINSSASLSLDEFIRLIYSTFPVITQRQIENPNLGESAKKYKKIKPLLREERERG